MTYMYAYTYMYVCNKKLTSKYLVMLNLARQLRSKSTNPTQILVFGGCGGGKRLDTPNIKHHYLHK